jgi:DNA polymerase
MAIRDVFLDFETYYGTGYSLRLNKYNTTSYVHDPQFKIHCANIQDGEDWHRLNTIGQMHKYFNALDWENINLVAHNVLFDGYILHDVFDAHPATYSCTLAMSRAVFQDEINNDLSSVATRLGFGEKMPDVLSNMANKRDLTIEEMIQLEAYCEKDTTLAREIYYALEPFMTDTEMELMHITYDCFNKPVLELDLERITEEYHRQLKYRDNAVAATGYAASNFSSAPKYTALLEKHGVDVPLKWSEKQEKLIPAVAKNDLEYIQLIAEWKPDTKLRHFATARELCASSINTTRPLRLLQAVENGRKLPIAYNYFGAMNTGRWSGGNKLNAQNFPRINKDNPLSGQCRRSILAPAGQMLCVQDLNAIEPRVNALFAGQWDMLQSFVDGVDQYCALARDIYGYAVDKSMFIERMVGKVGEIGLGYGMGWKTYQFTLAIGQFGPSVIIEKDVAQLAVNTYRHKRSKIKERWDELNYALTRMTEVGCAYEVGSLSFRQHRVILPSGRYLYYPGLRFSDEGELVYYSARYKGWTKIYGGKFDENLVQAIARDVLGEHMIKINRDVARVVMHTHDELVTLADEARAQAVCDEMAEVMSTPPDWAKDLPLAVSGGFSHEYSK